MLVHATPRAARRAGLIVPELLEDGRVCVDMGEPVLAPCDVPTTLRSGGVGGADASAPAVAAPLELGGRSWTVTAVSMGNPHAVVYSCDGAPVKVRHPAFAVTFERRLASRSMGVPPIACTVDLAACTHGPTLLEQFKGGCQQLSYAHWPRGCRPRFQVLSTPCALNIANIACHLAIHWLCGLVV
jgi:hypothetical protein